MRLVLKKNGNIVNEFRFDRGPVYIGRAVHNQVFLPEITVSRQHAVLFTTLDGQWMLEDMDSANKTYLNGKEIQKVEVKNGDCIRIESFTIEITLESDKAEQIHLEDTLVPSPAQTSAGQSRGNRDIIIRNSNDPHSPDIKLPAGRIKDFLQATEAICSANSNDELLNALLDIMFQQFNASQAWCALRNQPKGPFTSHAGLNKDGTPLGFDNITIKSKITQAADKGEFILLQKMPEEEKKIRSALIAPIMDPTGSFGVIYIGGSAANQTYNLSDLDYLMLLAIHTAAILENF
jgi:hypothetical protein